MNYANIRKYDVSNAPGICATLFVSGCKHNCEGCFNKEAQDFNFGNKFTKETEEEFMNICKNPNVKGVNILGGEPLAQTKDNTLPNLLAKIKEETNKYIWLWSGFTFEEIIKDPKKVDIVKNVDVLVDGKFELAKRDLMLKYRGSANQRIIDVQKSLKENRVIEKEIDGV